MAGRRAGTRRETDGYKRKTRRVWDNCLVAAAAVCWEAGWRECERGGVAGRWEFVGVVQEELFKPGANFVNLTGGLVRLCFYACYSINSKSVMKQTISDFTSLEVWQGGIAKL